MPRREIGPLALAGGGLLENVEIAYETWGDPGAPAVLVCHALTGDAHVARHSPEDAPGWWDGIVGPGCPIDTDRHYVIASNVIGGCYGSTGPRPGEPFARISVADMVQAQARLLEALSVERLAFVIGGSLGGMQALAWASIGLPRPERVIAVGASGSLGPLQVALCHAQHLAIELGLRRGDPRGALQAARAIAMTTYRSEQHFGERFGRTPSDRPGRDLALESYLDHHGERLADRFSAESYLALSRAMEFFEWDESVAAGTLVDLLPIDSDWLFPPQAVRELGARLSRRRVLGGIYPIRSDVGHDAFLADPTATGEAIRRALRAPCPTPRVGVHGD